MEIRLHIINIINIAFTRSVNFGVASGNVTAGSK